MKKILSILCVAILAIGLMAPALGMADTAAWVKTGNGRNLNVRAEAKTGDNVIGSIKYGTEVRILYYSANGKWACIELASGSDPGWVMTSYLVYYNPGKYVKKQTSEKTSDDLYSSFKMTDDEAYTVVAKPSKRGGFVSLRWAPSKSAPVMKKLFADAELTVLAEGKNWLQVQEESTGYVGFVDAKLVK